MGVHIFPKFLFPPRSVEMLVVVVERKRKRKMQNEKRKDGISLPFLFRDMHKINPSVDSFGGRAQGHRYDDNAQPHKLRAIS